MTDLDTLFRIIDELAPDERQQLFDYLKRQETVDKQSIDQPRTPDLFPGAWMSEDFDDELPDSFWLGEA